MLQVLSDMPRTDFQLTSLNRTQTGNPIIDGHLVPQLVRPRAEVAGFVCVAPILLLSLRVRVNARSAKTHTWGMATGGNL